MGTQKVKNKLKQSISGEQTNIRKWVKFNEKSKGLKTYIKAFHLSYHLIMKSKVLRRDRKAILRCHWAKGSKLRCCWRKTEALRTYCLALRIYSVLRIGWCLPMLINTGIVHSLCGAHLLECVAHILETTYQCWKPSNKPKNHLNILQFARFSSLTSKFCCSCHINLCS